MPRIPPRRGHTHGHSRILRNQHRQSGPAPAPDDSRKPDSPTDVTKPSWKYIAQKTLREFTKDQCPDLAAALTYYAVLSLFPAMLALVSLLGLFGRAGEDHDRAPGDRPGLRPGETVEDRQRTGRANSPAPPLPA